MTSINYYMALFCGIASFIFYKQNKNEMKQYTFSAIIWVYLFSRVVPFIMLQDKQSGMLIGYLADILVNGAIFYRLQCKKQKVEIKQEFLLMLLSPLPTVTILSGNVGYALGALVVQVLLAESLRAISQKYSEHSWNLFFAEYLLGTAALSVLFSASVYYGQNIEDCFQREGAVPTYFILGLFLLIMTIVLLIGKIRKLHKNPGIQKMQKRTVNREKAKEAENVDNVDSAADVEDIVKAANKLSAKGLIFLLIIILVYSALIFYKIGSKEAPQSYQTFSTTNGTNEIVLDLGQETQVSKMWIYLGYQGKRLCSFSGLDVSTGTWNLFKSKHTLETAFDWNKVDVNQKLRYLGMVFLDETAYIQEIVILDNNGKIITPVNSEVYTNLFDEQSLYHGDSTYYDGMMFDEIYHGRTAYEFIHDLPIYENTHPPLGKTLISIGIQLFGMNPFGWRFVCAICGILIIPVTFFWMWSMTGNEKNALLTTILMASGFMHFTLSRIATLDIIVAFFVLVMFYTMFLYIKSMNEEKPTYIRYLYLLCCGVATGLAIACKWTGVYSAMGIAVMFFISVFLHYWKQIHNKKTVKELMRLFGVCVISFVVVPLCIYVLSYIPFIEVYTDKSLIQAVIENGELMLSYHQGTVFEHPYSSEWYEWLIDKRSLLDSLTYVDADTVSSVVTLGNPLILLGGLAALLYNIYLWRCKGNQTSGCLIIAYFSMLMPWFFVHRTVFIYQYFISALILVFLIGYTFHNLKGKYQRQYKLVVILSCILFLMYLPVLSGYYVSADYVNQVLELLTSWAFA